ncbi:DEAD/DEAH box helicase [Vibrio sp. 10N.261.55.A7]|uniref:DEAD/DEAH box helicase n=1 Tax=Vibrio TaxID=662 RepID=UPI000C83CEB2|nr:DEAD/DEAH box helicase [Vibrio sp. 10N.261.55.A7]PMJ89883.1 DEAD/DEAH box helicase [Vibrio sp. 10N.261.55.A7]
MPFSKLNLSPALTDKLSPAFETPTAIQQQAIPVLLEGHDLLAIAQTGSGKTLAYGLPLIEKSLNSGTHSIASIVIVPTRELAKQVHADLIALSNDLHIHSVLLTGGVDKETQLTQLSSEPSIVIATPGRLLDLIQSGDLTTDSVNQVVLDEADRLLDMGFWPDIDSILAKLPKTKQTAMFSATLAPQLSEHVNAQLKQPIQVQVNPANQVVDNVEEQLFLVNKGSKTKALIHKLKTNNWPQVLVFIGAKDNADSLRKKLSKAGISCAALHGDKSQQDREQALHDFKQQSIQVLIATDILARGIHIDRLPVVINFELPTDPTVYVHRVGRTARSGQQGMAISLICHAEQSSLEAIRHVTNRPLLIQTLVEFPVTDKPSNGESKRAPRDKKANRRTNTKNSVKQFKKKPKKRS